MHMQQQSFATPKQQALIIVQQEQDVLAQAYQVQQRQFGHEYGLRDALDMVIGMASDEPVKFLAETLPDLRRIADEQGILVYDFELL